MNNKNNIYNTPTILVIDFGKLDVVTLSDNIGEDILWDPEDETKTD